MNSAPHHVGSEEYIIVNEGVLEKKLILQYIQLTIIKLFRFNSDVPHCYRNRGNVTAVFTSTMYYQ